MTAMDQTITEVIRMQPQADICRIRWIIQNYSFCFRETNSPLCSPSFSVAFLCDTKWNLRLYPSGDESSTFLALYLVKSQEETISHLKKGKRRLGDDNDYEFDVVIKVIGSSDKILGIRKFNAKRISSNELGSSHFVKIKEIGSGENDDHEDTLTICCRILRKNPYVPKIAGYVLQTEICVDRLTFKSNYMFKRYSNITNMVRKRLNFPGRGNFEVVFYEPADNYFNRLLISIFYEKSKSPYYKGCIVECNLILKDGSDEICTKKEKHRFDHFPDTWDFPSDVFSAELQKFRRNFVAEKEFVILGEFTCSNSDETHSVAIDNAADSAADYADIYPIKEENSRNILMGQNCSDAKPNLMPDHQVVDHKDVLITGSPVSQVVFEPHKHAVKTEIFDKDINAMNLFFEHLYADHEKELEYEQAKVLVKAAEKFCKHVTSFKEKCLASLKSKINEGNACEILSLADAVGDTQLKSTVINFLVANSGKILSSPQWLFWMKNNMELASLVMLKITANLSALQISGCASSSDNNHQHKRKRMD